MNSYLIDNKDVFSDNGIIIISLKGIFEDAPMRVSMRKWADKSGVDIDTTNPRSETREITLECICIAKTKQELANNLKAFSDEFSKSIVSVFSIRGDVRNAFLVYKEAAIKGKYSKAANGEHAYEFSLKLLDVNPKAAKWLVYTYQKEARIDFVFNNPAFIYWGDGNKELADRAGIYTHLYEKDSDIDIIIDADGKTLTSLVPVIGNGWGFVFSAKNNSAIRFEFKIVNELVNPSMYDSVHTKLLDYYDPSSYAIYLGEWHGEGIVEDVVEFNARKEDHLFSLRQTRHRIGDVSYLFETKLLDNLLKVIIKNSGLLSFQIGAYEVAKEHLDLSGNDINSNDINLIFYSYGKKIEEGVLLPNGYLDVSGGTNAAPHSDYNEIISTMRLQGWTILTN
jgi:hypothetical protein